MVWPALIAGGAALLGGAMAARSQRSANASNAALQREFAQYGIRWKVEDAKAAGLHPLYAIGAVTPSAQASYQSSPMGSYVAQAGTEAGRQLSYERERRSRGLESSRNRQLMQDQLILEQMKARSQINVDTAQANYYNALAAAAGQPSGRDGATSIEGINDQAAIKAQQDSGKVVVKPKELTTNKPGSPSVEAGENPLWVVEKGGGSLKSVRLNDEAAEAWGDVAAPIINAAATAYFYMTKTLPEVSKKNWKWLVKWYFNNREEINRRMKDKQPGLQYGP